LVLDAPPTGLDFLATGALRALRRAPPAAGRCIVLSSHVMQEVAALCDVIVVIAHGRVVAHGTPDEIRAQAGEGNLEDAFVKVIGSGEGLLA
jgi:sodium transport system ATP-binding protein